MEPQSSDGNCANCCTKIERLLAEVEILKARVQNLENKQSSTSSKKAGQKISPKLRQDVHSTYQRLRRKEDFEGFQLNEQFSSPSNKRILQEVIQNVSSNSKEIPHDADQITDVTKIYFRSLRDDAARSKKGEKERHRRSSKLYQRKRKKMQCLTQALERIAWSDAKKIRMKEALKVDYMSTEESADDDGEPVFIVHERTWESDRLKRYKLNLLDHYEKENKPGQFKSRKRKRNIAQSGQPPPDCPINWAVKIVNP